MNLSKLQEEQAVWCKKNFPHNKPYYELLGLIDDIRYYSIVSMIVLTVDD